MAAWSQAAPRRIVANLGWSLGGKSVGAACGLILLALAARTLGPAGFGQFTLAVALAQLIGTVTGFQTWQIIVRFGAQNPGPAGRNGLARLCRFGAALDAGGALAGIAVVAIVAPAIGARFGWDAAFIRAVVAFSAVVLLSARSTAIGVLRLCDRHRATVAVDGLTAAVRVLGGAVAATWQPSVTGFLAAWAAAEIGACAACWMLAIRTGYFGSRPGKLLRVPAENAGLWRLVWSTSALGSLSAGSKHLMPLLVGTLLDPVSAGAYRVAAQLGQAVSKLGQLIWRSALTDLVRLQAERSAAEMQRIVRWGTLCLAGPAVLTMLVGVALAPWLVRELAGPGFEDAALPLAILAAAGLVRLVSGLVEPALAAAGRVGAILAIAASAAAAEIAATTFLAPSFGLPGAAIAALTASLASAICLQLAWRRAGPARHPKAAQPV